MEGKKEKEKNTPKGGFKQPGKKMKTDDAKCTPRRTLDAGDGLGDLFRLPAPRVRQRTRAGQYLNNVSSRMTRSVSSAASWLRSRHALIRKGKEQAMRPHTTKARNVDCQLDHPGSLAGLSHPTDPDIGHELGKDGCLAATLQKHLPDSHAAVG
ncbi:hypothetical protein KVR01_010261 [Diaporthe batatas]|uniref:uncharacterized protein n=1 Tax=Diaporthe batatas TaxID=748121 RepID=UPI001D044E7C|nr:uncharacterized protein KVR01_010261 [Diaporthe batatas]KAG8159624.1 hypothetical protein KVR01_010261 [Diaporthe batatas]